jgi:hypothetical protein
MVSPAVPPLASGGIVGPLGDNTGVGTGPGPLRHPRPLTAADLHLQLEKEQEAVVCTRCSLLQFNTDTARSID